MKDLVLMPQARRDMVGLCEHSVKTWGEAHWSKRSAMFVASFDQIRRFPGSGVERSKFFSLLRSVSVDPHIIFYLEREDAVVAIRILDGRQDLDALDFSTFLP